MHVISNGSKWAGEDPDTLDVLLQCLEEETLDPRFEKYGNFVHVEADGLTHAFGNFLTYSHVFNIRGTAEELSGLEQAIRKNQRTRAYRVARRSASV